MRIGVVCPVWFPVPPEAYGGTERVVALLADGLVAAGHDVTLFASGDSQTRARLEYVFATAPSEWIGHTYWELQHAVHAFRRSREFDIVHDHTGMLGLALGGLAGRAVLPYGARAARRPPRADVRAHPRRSRRTRSSSPSR